MRVFTIAALCVFTVCSCAQTKTVKVKIYGDRYQQIMLHKKIDAEGNPVATGFAHPVDFDVNNLKYLLRSIQYQDKGFFGWSEFKPVFAANELYRLGPHLAEAFANASPDDEIVFQSTAAKGGTVFASERYTDGVMFVKDNKLNCLFGNINVKLATTEKYEGDPRKEYAGVLVKLVARDWQKLVEGPKGTHYNWIEIDSKSVLARKMKAERMARERLKRIREMHKDREIKESGWEDWEPGETVHEEEETSIEDDVVWPSE